MGRARKRTGAAVLTLLACFSFLTVYIASTSTSQPWPNQAPPTADVSGSNYAEAIRQLNLSPEFEYRRQCIKPRQRIGLKRASYTNVTGSFLADPTILTTASLADPAPDLENIISGCAYTITLDVPADAQQDRKAAPDTDTSSLMLGMATSLERITQSLPELARWLSDTGSPLLVILRDQDSVDTSEAKAALDLAHKLHVLLTLIPRGKYASAGGEAALERRAFDGDQENGGEAQSNFGLCRAFVAAQTPSTVWFGVIDDDTFFLSLPAMLRSLAPYDPSQQLYIGALSERRLGMNTEGFKAWGGAGIFLSSPLVKVLADSYDSCVAMAGTWGDALWRDCIQRVTTPTVQLTLHPGLHQLDMLGDVSGWYESGPWPIHTLHHWKSWHVHPVPAAHLVVDVAGTQSFLGRHAWPDQGVVLTNGYSVVLYPLGIPDLRLAERTITAYPEANLRDGDREYRFSLGRLREKLEDTRKISWRLEHAVTDEGGAVRQFYVRRGERDSVVEVDWIR